MEIIFVLVFITFSLVSIFYFNKYLILKYFLFSFITTTVLYTVVIGSLSFHRMIDGLIDIIGLVMSVYLNDLRDTVLFKFLLWYGTFLLINLITYLILNKSRIENNKYSFIHGVVIALFMNLTLNVLPVILTLVTVS